MDLPTALNAATTAAVVGGVIFGGWQIRVAARSRQTQIALHLMEVLYARDLMEGLSALNDLQEGLTWNEMQVELGERWFLAFTLIQTLDGLGILVRRGEVALSVSDDFFHHAVAVVWQKSQAAILQRRTFPGRESAFEFLEWLAKRQEAFRAEQRHKLAA
jgi:hypothetical protein